MTKLRLKKHTIGLILVRAVGFFFLVANLRHFAMYRYLKKYVVTNSLLFWEKKSSENERKKNPKKFAKNRHNCLQCERVLKIFLISYFEYQQIWLNIIVNKNSHSRSNIMGPNQQGYIRSPSELGSLVGVFISTFKIHSE